MKDWLWSVVVSVMESDEALQREAKLSRAVLSLARTNRDLKERLELVMLERDEARDILGEYDLGEGTRSLDFVLANITAIRQAKAEGKPGPWEDTPVVVSDDARESLFAKLMSWPTAEAPTALLAQEAGVPPAVAVGAMLSMAGAGRVRYRNDGIHFWWSLVKCKCCGDVAADECCKFCDAMHCLVDRDEDESGDLGTKCLAIGLRLLDLLTHPQHDGEPGEGATFSFILKALGEAEADVFDEQRSLEYDKLIESHALGVVKRYKITEAGVEHLRGNFEVEALPAATVPE